MTNEITVVELYGANNDGDKRRFTVASGTAITKGTLLTLSDDRTAAKCVASGAVIAGIAAADKDGTDFSTSISAWTNGIFEIYASGAIAVGAKVQSADADNTVGPHSDEGASGAAIIGYALEAADAAETINVRVIL